MRQIQGVIALDIDGTLTADLDILPENVVSYLSELYENGWEFVFITGRTFTWGKSLLKQFPFPYFFAAQNGAILIEMPSCKLIHKKYLPVSICSALEKICTKHSTEFVIYSGFENQDLCYFRPKQFTNTTLHYLKNRSSAHQEELIEFTHFSDLPLSEFASFKLFGEKEFLSMMTEQIETSLDIHIPLNRDPFNHSFYVAQGTRSKVDKGEALHQCLQHFPKYLLVIAAGDDQNDIPMLMQADIKVVMATAPAHMLSSADVIAPPAKEQGIITGLKQAIDSIKER